MHEPPATFDELLAALGDEVTGGRMMGRSALMRDGTMIACFSFGALGIKLGRDTPELAAALEVPGAELFDPGASGRPFRGWAAIPTAQSDAWLPHVRAAIDAADAAAMDGPAP